MSKHNRERRMLWKLGLTMRQRDGKVCRQPQFRGDSIYRVTYRYVSLLPWLRSKATHDEIRAAKAARLAR